MNEAMNQPVSDQTIMKSESKSDSFKRKYTKEKDMNVFIPLNQ